MLTADSPFSLTWQKICAEKATSATRMNALSLPSLSFDNISPCHGPSYFVLGSRSNQGRKWTNPEDNHRNLHCTVGSDENFQIPSQKIIFEISGPGPSYTSIGSSQDHIWSYFEHMCWSAQVECGGV